MTHKSIENKINCLAKLQTQCSNPKKYLKFSGACVIWTMVLNNEEYFFVTKEYFKNIFFYFSVFLVPFTLFPFLRLSVRYLWAFIRILNCKELHVLTFKEMWLLKRIDILPISLFLRFGYLYIWNVKMFCIQSTDKL